VQPLGVLVYLFRRQLAFGMGGKPQKVRMPPGLSSSWYNSGCGGGAPGVWAYDGLLEHAQKGAVARRCGCGRVV
jgi:hypothetical protein